MAKTAAKKIVKKQVKKTKDDVELEEELEQTQVKKSAPGGAKRPAPKKIIKKVAATNVKRTTPKKTVKKAPVKEVDYESEEAEFDDDDEEVEETKPAKKSSTKKAPAKKSATKKASTKKTDKDVKIGTVEWCRGVCKDQGIKVSSQSSRPTKQEMLDAIGEKRLKELGYEAKAPKRKRKEQNPNMPKKPQTAYMIFSTKIRPKIKEENPDASFADLSRLIGKKWKSLSDKAKKPYTDEANKLKEAYLKEKSKHEQPKKKRSSYIYFSSDVREKIAKENPGMDITEIAKIIGQKWKNLKNKQKYIDLAEKDKIRYEKELAAYYKREGIEPPTKKASAKSSSKKAPAKKSAPKKSTKKLPPKEPEIDEDEIDDDEEEDEIEEKYMENEEVEEETLLEDEDEEDEENIDEENIDEEDDEALDFDEDED